VGSRDLILTLAGPLDPALVDPGVDADPVRVRVMVAPPGIALESQGFDFLESQSPAIEARLGIPWAAAEDVRGVLRARLG